MITIDKNKWQVGKIKEFLDKAKQAGATNAQLEVITPVAIPSKNYEELRKAYMLSTKKLKRLYLIPVVSLGHTILYKNVSWYVYPLYHLNEWFEFLLRECQIKIPLETFEPDKYAIKAIESQIKFWQKPIEKAFVDFPKIRVGNKAFGYSSIDEPLKVKEIK